MSDEHIPRARPDDIEHALLVYLTPAEYREVDFVITHHRVQWCELMITAACNRPVSLDDIAKHALQCARQVLAATKESPS